MKKRREERMKEYYYYIRDKENRPIVTVCLLIFGDDKTVARGMAFCCPKDIPCKKVGRKIALERAKYSAAFGRCGCRITSRLDFQHSLKYDFKSYYKPMLTEQENKILYGNPL